MEYIEQLDVKRIAFAGDWHANSFWARAAIDYAAEQEADVIVHLGDYGYEFTNEFRRTVESALLRTGLTLFFVDGNHENFHKLYNWPIKHGLRQVSKRVYHLPRGFSWIWNEVQFLALGGAFSVDRQWRVLNESWWAEETLTEMNIAYASAAGAVDVMVSHDCPSGVYIPGLEQGAIMFPHDALVQANEHRHRLREVVDAIQPRFIWHGHYHRAYMTTHDFGYGPVQVCGLDMDGVSLRANVMAVDLATLKKETSADADTGHDYLDHIP